MIDKRSRKRKFLWFENEYLWTVKRTCQRCRITYKECDNTAAWKCRFHPRPLTRHYNLNAYDIGKYQCCGQRSNSRGCTAIDHDDGEYKHDKQIYFKKGINPLTLSTDAQDRLWNDRGGYQPIYYRPGMRTRPTAANSYVLRPYNVAVADRRDVKGYLDRITFGIKVGNDLQIVSLEVRVRRSIPLGRRENGLQTKLLFNYSNIHDASGHQSIGDIMTLRSGEYSYFTFGSSKLPLPDQSGSKWAFVDTTYIKGRQRVDQSFESVVKHVLKNRHALADPKIAFFLRTTPPTAPHAYDDSRVMLRFSGTKITAFTVSVKRDTTKVDFKAILNDKIPNDGAVFLHPFNTSGCSLESFCDTVYPKIKLGCSSIVVELVQMN